MRTFIFRGNTRLRRVFYLQIVEGLETEDKFQNKNETENERKKERKKKGRKNFQEGRGKKPKMQMYLNSQVIKKVKKVKTKQKKRRKKLYIMKAR